MSGKGKGKGKARASTPELASPTPATESPLPSSSAYAPSGRLCPLYLPPLQTVDPAVRDRALAVSVRAVAATLEAPDADAFFAASAASCIPEFIESYLRFRSPVVPGVSVTAAGVRAIDRAADALTFAWFRRLAASLASATTDPSAAHAVLSSVSALALVDFAKWYGHTGEPARSTLGALLGARPDLEYELADVVRVATHLMSTAVHARMEQRDGDAPSLVAPVADALAAFAAVLELAPFMAPAFDDAFLATLFAFHDLLVGAADEGVSGAATEFVAAVIAKRFLEEPSAEAVGHLMSVLDMLVGGSGNADAAESLMARVAASTDLVDQLTAPKVKPWTAGFESVIARLQTLRTRKSKPAVAGPTSTSASTNLDAAVLASTVQQVQDLFPLMTPAQITSLLPRFANDTARLIDALLTDPALQSHVPPEQAAAAEAARDAAAEAAEAKLRASIRARLAAMDAFDPASVVRKRQAKLVEDDAAARAEAKAAVLRRAAAIAAMDDEDEAEEAAARAMAMRVKAAPAAGYEDDEYDDTYDAVDVHIADGATADQVDPEAAMRARRGGGAKEAAASAAGRPPAANIVPADPAARNEETLFRAFQRSPDVFQRTAKSTAERADLRKATGMSDQQIEGWASMLRREPARMRRLEARFQFAGNHAPAARAAPAADAAPSRGGRSGGGRGGGKSGDASDAPSPSADANDRGGSGSPSRSGGRGGGRGGRGDRLKQHWKKTADKIY
ncbi:hypothetical protein H9P43_001879 [Blastocladiella emersonii ATCC 22665]|nr:hypothetical protein H9P43_001879 [Blastocladiella emersonii ATCC 22665]